MTSAIHKEKTAVFSNLLIRVFIRSIFRAKMPCKGIDNKIERSKKV
jgi:hypothetical protein